MKFHRPAETIEAKRWNGSVENATEIIDWVLANGGTARYDEELGISVNVSVNRLPSRVLCVAGEYIAKRENGEFFVQDSSLEDVWEWSVEE